MILFTNLENVQIEGKNYNPVPILKLTTAKDFYATRSENLELINLLKTEAKTNRFRLLINDKFY
jgi:hypothetical protein